MALGASAVFLFAIAGIWIWKRRFPRVVAWLLLFAGGGIAGSAVNLLGGNIQHMSVGGVALFSVIAIGGLIIFYEEAIKQNGHHRVRTNIVAVVTGIAVMTAPASFFTGVQNAGNSLRTNLNQSVNTSLNGK